MRKPLVEPSLGGSEFRLRAMVENLPAAAVYVDGENLFFNKAAEEMLGYGRDEITTVDEWFQTLLGERSGVERSFYHWDRDVGFPCPRLLRVRRKDGEKRYLEFAAYRYEPGEVWLLHDATERKEAEEALRQERDFAEGLVETAPAIVLVLDPAGRIVRFNRYMEEISGYTLEEVRGRDWIETFLPEHEHEHIRELFHANLDDEPTRGTVNTVVTQDGDELDIEWYNTLLRDGEGRVTGVLSIGQDITERRRLEAQFQQAQKMEAIGRLAGGVAHDFNTLLGSVMGYAEMLLDGLRPQDPLRHAAEQIHRGAERGATLTRQLLAFSRRQVLRPHPLDLAEVVAEMNDMLGRLIGADITLEIEVAPDLQWVRVDSGQIEQVILNLAVNAGDAMPRGGRLVITADNVTLDELTHLTGHLLEPGEYVRLQVTDTGCGMDEATRERVFEPFFTTKEVGKGTGLGLSTVYGIVKQSDGALNVSSEPGGGSTFEIYLPAVEAQKTPVKPPEVAAETASDRGAETVLLVEDDEMFRELLEEVLAANGYTVLTAAGPDAALTLREDYSGHVDLVVSDMVMPGMTGLELARELHERHPEMRVLLMSGYTGEDLAQRGVEDHAAPFLQKPFSTGELLAKVREIVGN